MTVMIMEMITKVYVTVRQENVTVKTTQKERTVTDVKRVSMATLSE